MFIQLFAALMCGIIAGIVAGIVPGIHTNLVSVLVLSVSPLLLKYTNIVCVAVFLIAMSVVHIFLSCIPAIFLGAPDSDNALGVLPGHRFLLRGRGMEAVKLNLVGCFAALVLSIALFPILVPAASFIYPFLEKIMGYLLLAIVLFMILRDSNRLWAAVVFILSGILGLIVLNWPSFKDPLFPLFSGLFGVSTLVYSLNSRNKIPKQSHDTKVRLKKKVLVKALLAGNVCGFITALLPGLSTSIAAAISLQFTRNMGEDGFMVLLGSINVFNFILSIATLYAIDKARNGSVVAVQQLVESISANHLVIFLAAALAAGGAAVFLALKIGEIFAKLVSKVNYKKLVLSVVIFVALLVFLLTGIAGVAVLAVSACIGMLAPLLNVRRTHAMACLLLPCIVYYLM